MSMSLKDHPAIIVITLILMAAGFAWKLGYDSSENRVKTLEAQIAAHGMAEELGLEELLSDIRSAAKQLAGGLEVSRQADALQRELQEAKRREAALQAELATAQSELAETEIELRQSEALVRSIYAESVSFSLAQHTTQDLLGYELAAGLVSLGVSDATVIFDNKEVRLRPGGEVSAARRGKTCTLRLKRIDYPKSAEFLFYVHE